MFEVRIHGRGGQGVVTAAEMLSVAGFIEGRWAQAFPSFGSERMGAPVVSFCRLHDSEIRAREPITAPDALIIQDPTLLHQVRVFDGLAPAGYVLINSSRPIEALGIGEVAARLPKGHMAAIAATELAVRHVGRPVPNAVLLGAFCAMTGVMKLESVEAAIRQKFRPALAEKNIAAAREAFGMIAGGAGAGAGAGMAGGEDGVRHAEAV
ncbi:MAG: 2-oxoacid:acceptor oxidoreductase family protein [Phycisphaerales bacterium]|nr:2-oxoacid:acceptor oxidoreductase family protein [Phycisphaerales bacterium]